MNTVNITLIFSPNDKKTEAGMTALQKDGNDNNELFLKKEGDFLKPNVENNGDISSVSLTQCGDDFIEECIKLIAKILPENTPIEVTFEAKTYNSSHELDGGYWTLGHKTKYITQVDELSIYTFEIGTLTTYSCTEGECP